jgi:hypothetical protein
MSRYGAPGGDPETPLSAGPFEAAAVRENPGSPGRKPRRRRRFYGRRVCPVCGREFTATTSNQRFCPPTDADRAKGNLQTRSWCAKAHDNALHRGRLEQLLARVEVRGAGRHPFNCVYCDKRCVPGEDGVAPHATKFCCRRHKAKWHREASRAA